MSSEPETEATATTMTTEHTNTQKNKEQHEISEVLFMARDRLTENDKGRAAIQKKLSCKCGRIENMINEMRERLLTEISTAEEKDTDLLMGLISDGHGLLVASEEIADNNKLQSFIEKATAALQKTNDYKVTETKFYKTEGGPKNILSIKVAEKHREFKMCPYDIDSPKKNC